MKKVKGLLALVLLTSALFRISATNADIIVLMDASGTIFPWFDQINNTILVDITKKFVRPGDTFHLISFNSRVNLEIVQPIKTEADISRVVSRFMLLYPLGQNSDFLSGLQYTWQYAASLDQKLDKIVIILSDGIYNPPKSSQYASFSNEEVKNELISIARKIRGAGWSVYYIKLPFPEGASIVTLDGNLLSVPKQKQIISDSESNSTNQTTTADIEPVEYIDISGSFSSIVDIQLNTVNQTDGTIKFDTHSLSLPEVIYPSTLGKKGRGFSLPLKIENTSNKTLNLELTGVYVKNTNVLNQNSFISIAGKKSKTYKADILLPDSLPLENQKLQVTLQFAGNERVNPQSAVIDITLVPFSLETFIKKSSSIVINSLIVLFSILLVIILLIIITRRTSRPVLSILNAQNEEDKEKKLVASTNDVGGSASGVKVTASAVSPTSTVGPNSSKGLPPNASAAAISATSQRFVLEKSETTSSTDTLSDFSNLTKQKELSVLDSLAVMQEAEKERRNSILTLAGEKATLPAHVKKQPLLKKHSFIKKAASSNDKIETLSDKRILLELHVNRQNPHIGKRNIHIMKAGSRLSIGGGHSSFLVFLVPFPSKIAEIRYDGVSCSIAILKPEFFPYETNAIIENCIGREITLLSEKNYEISFYMKEYEDPVLALNNILNSIVY